MTGPHILDASTAFRTDPAWAYGLPELNEQQRAKIKAARRVAVPGCHASAFILAVAPLISAGILLRDAVLSCFSLTGYSGGGKKMIAAYEAAEAPVKLRRPAALCARARHKHLPEMQKIPGSGPCAAVHAGGVQHLQRPGGGDFLPPAALASGTTLEALHHALSQHYHGEKFVRVMPLDPMPTARHGRGLPRHHGLQWHQSRRHFCVGPSGLGRRPGADGDCGTGSIISAKGRQARPYNA